MRDCNHSQVFTVFGGSYVTERHGFNHLPPKERSPRSSTKLAAVAGLLILGITTATAMKVTRSPDGLWAQHSRSTWAVAAFEDALY